MPNVAAVRYLHDMIVPLAPIVGVALFKTSEDIVDLSAKWPESVIAKAPDGTIWRIDIDGATKAQRADVKAAIETLSSPV